MSAKKGDFVDKEDFTPEHDRLMRWLIRNWKEVVLKYVGHDKFNVITGAFHGEFVLKEPYKPDVYPDGFAQGAMSADHRHVEVQVLTNPTLGVECEVCRALVDANRSNERAEKVDGVHAHLFCEFTGCGKHAVSTDPEVISKAQGLAWNTPCAAEYFSVIFEVKPRIRSYGCDLRQINVYRSRVPGATILLITTDDRWDEEFAGEGVVVVHPPEEHEQSLEDAEPALNAEGGNPPPGASP